MPGAPREPQLRVAVARSAAGAVVHLDGELDIATAGDLDDVLRALTAERPQPHVVVDAENLEFVDAAGLAPLLRAHSILPQGSLRLRNVRSPIARVLRLLDLATAFGIDG